MINIDPELGMSRTLAKLRREKFNKLLNDVLDAEESQGSSPKGSQEYVAAGEAKLKAIRILYAELDARYPRDVFLTGA